ncbi:hypothetical protein R3P38DRAFT_3244119 [Favolaschia claudopus]|uniref:DUF6534 domain-containing protein n=1 Tax=Favolaschia claudopus TaxID=2862362 RepID=A0AAV9Z2H6_9AGAR
MSLRLGFSLPTRIVARGSLIRLDNLLGAWLIGLILSSVLFGISCLQVHLYFTKSCSRDRAILKAFVIGLFALDAFHLALVSHSLYSVVVTNFGDYIQLGIIPWSLLLQTVFGSFLSAMVRLFYAWRVYIISNNFLLLPVGVPMHYGMLAEVEFQYSERSTHIKFFIPAEDLFEHLFIWSSLGLGIGAAADVLIAGTMIYYLSKNKTGFQKTNKAINRLVAHSLSTGALACVFAIGDVIAVQFNKLSAETVSPASLDHAPLNSRDRGQVYAGDHAMVAIPSYPPATNVEYATSSVTKVRESRSTELTDSRRVVSSTLKENVV